jgi:bifunctional non-homologous end joining protein LigD
VTATWLTPELATLTKARFSDPAWVYERKFDGERCLTYRTSGEVALMTRNQIDVSATYPELHDALARQSSADFVVDGEIVAFDGDATSFGKLQQRLGVRDPDADLLRRVPVVYYLFDVLAIGGRDVRSLPLSDRKPLLRELLSFEDPVRFTEHVDGNGEPFWDEACRKGWEGLIAKRSASPYLAGRSKDWLKFKCLSSQEFVIGGYTDPQGT